MKAAAAAGGLGASPAWASVSAWGCGSAERVAGSASASPRIEAPVVGRR